MSHYSQVFFVYNTLPHRISVFNLPRIASSSASHASNDGEILQRNNVAPDLRFCIDLLRQCSTVDCHKEILKNPRLAAVCNKDARPLTTIPSAENSRSSIIVASSNEARTVVSTVRRQTPRKFSMQLPGPGDVTCFASLTYIDEFTNLNPTTGRFGSSATYIEVELQMDLFMESERVETLTTMQVLLFSLCMVVFYPPKYTTAYQRGINNISFMTYSW